MLRLLAPLGLALALEGPAPSSPPPPPVGDCDGPWWMCPHVRPDSAVDYCEQLVDGVQEGQPACLRTEPEKYADADKYFKHPFRKCSYKSGLGSEWIKTEIYKELDTIATDGEACSRMIQTKYPEAEGAHFGATEITRPDDRQTTPAGFCVAIMSVTGFQFDSYTYSYEAHEEAGNDGRYSWCLFGEKWGGPNPYDEGDDEEASHWAQPASASEPGTLVNVCRPAALPESLDRSQIKSATVLETELKVVDRAPCPGDARLVIAHLAPDPARDPRGLTRAICTCDHYVGASSVPPAGERMCAKDMLDPTAAGGRFGHLDHTPVMCYPTGANFPAVGKDDGGALAWHGCRSDQRPCTMPLTCTWTPGFPDSESFEEETQVEPVGYAPSAKACSAMVQNKAPWANAALYHILLSGLPLEARDPQSGFELKSGPPRDPGLCIAIYYATEATETIPLWPSKTYKTCKFDGWQARDVMPKEPIW